MYLCIATIIIRIAQTKRIQVTVEIQVTASIRKKKSTQHYLQQVSQTNHPPFLHFFLLNCRHYAMIRKYWPLDLCSVYFIIVRKISSWKDYKFFFLAKDCPFSFGGWLLSPLLSFLKCCVLVWLVSAGFCCFLSLFTSTHSINIIKYQSINFYYYLLDLFLTFSMKLIIVRTIMASLACYL